MKKSAYGKPILFKDNDHQVLDRIDIVDEDFIQQLVFDHPECIPISDIDESYNPMIPLCTELETPVGPLDIFMTTPNGDLAIIETKLWRNPDARRKVIAQILDYANELSKWSYEDLQRQLNKRLKSKGNILFETVKRINPDLVLDESDFVDAVTRNLFLGKFLLLIIGDGIREGASSIADFLTNSGHLNFSFGMVELTIYSLNDKTRMVIPRTIVKTTEIQKVNIELPEGMVITNKVSETMNSEQKNQIVSPELLKQREFFEDFWGEFIDKLELDDPGQPHPNKTKSQNIYLYPGKNSFAWISAYFSQSSKRVGVYFRCQNNNSGLNIMEGLMEFKSEIEAELGQDIIWSWDSDLKQGFGVRLPMDDVYAPENRKVIMEFFAVWLNRFVNAIRPRLQEIQ